MAAKPSEEPIPPRSPAPATSNPPAQGATVPPPGTYAMKNPAGQVVQIPYPSVGKALDQGHLFADQDTLKKYARDHAADPLDESRVDQFIDVCPSKWAPARSTRSQAASRKRSAPAIACRSTRGETDLQLAAATPSHTAAEAGGEAAEGLGEYFSGSILLARRQNDRGSADRATAQGSLRHRTDGEQGASDRTEVT